MVTSTGMKSETNLTQMAFKYCDVCYDLELNYKFIQCSSFDMSDSIEKLSENRAIQLGSSSEHNYAYECMVSMYV